MQGFTGLDLVGALFAASLTIMVLSYLVADNPLFRLATHIFIGVAAGYAGTLAWYNILRPALVDPLVLGGLRNLMTGVILTTEEGRLVLIGWLLILLLLFKLSPATARLGTIPMAILVGVAAAVIVGGAITGTLVPQSLAAMDSLSPTAVSTSTGESGFERSINVAIVLVGTLSTLLYFRFSARPGPGGEALPTPWLTVGAQVGRFFIAVAFGTMFAGALSTATIALGERVESLIDLVFLFLGTF
jgi:hypothetical protein